MFRVVSVRSLTFSEHQTETREIRDQAFKARKVKEVKLDAVVDRKAGTEKRMTKNSNPSVVDAVIQRRAEETKRDQVGVWSPLGYMYEPQGRPELELGEDRTLREMLAKRKPRRSAAEDSSATGKQKLEGLVDLFRDTKHTLAAINLFNRSSTAQAIDPSRPAALRALAAEQSEAPKASAKQDFKAFEKMTTTEKISTLGTNYMHERMVQSKKLAEIERKRRSFDHLHESRESHLMRWRDQFEEKKGTKDRALMQTLVSRAEARDQVYDSPTLLNHAVHIASKHAASATATMSQARALAHSTSATSISLWDKAKTREARKVEIQRQIDELNRKALEAEENRRAALLAADDEDAAEAAARSAAQAAATASLQDHSDAPPAPPPALSRALGPGPSVKALARSTSATTLANYTTPGHNALRSLTRLSPAELVAQERERRAQGLTQSPTVSVSSFALAGDDEVGIARVHVHVSPPEVPAGAGSAGAAAQRAEPAAEQRPAAALPRVAESPTKHVSLMPRRFVREKMGHVSFAQDKSSLPSVAPER